jgi:uncharacterized membrane protein HdeD (DUF308 family)
MLVSVGYKYLWIELLTGTVVGIALYLVAQFGTERQTLMVGVLLASLLIEVSCRCVIVGIRLSKQGNDRAVALTILFGVYLGLISVRFLITSLLELQR